MRVTTLFLVGILVTSASAFTCTAPSRATTASSRLYVQSSSKLASTSKTAPPVRDMQDAGISSFNVQQTSSASAVTADISKDDSNNSLLWKGVVVALCAVWASNFAVAKLVLNEPGVDSSLYALSRFGVAALSLAPFAWAQRKTLDAETVQGAVQCGSWVAFGYLGQTLSLLSTTASRACVICTLHCVFVAVVTEFGRMQLAKESLEETTAIPSLVEQKDDDPTKFDLMRLIPAAVAVLGVAIVELQGAAGAPTVGDALAFCQPIGFGMGYLQLEGLMARNPQAALPVSALKLAVVAAASLGMYELGPLVLSSADAPFAVPDFGPILSSPVALAGIAYTGLITTALALYVESIAFRNVPATDASLLLTTEPIFAAGAGAYALGETFGLSDYVGASLIIGACALAVLMDEGDEDCEPDDALQGQCELPKSFPMSAE